MSYLPSKRYRGVVRRRAGMSGLGGIGDLLVAGVNVANDPYLSEVLCHLTQLQQIKAGGQPQACAETQPGLTGGIGLSRAVVPMRAYVFAEDHKWAYAVAAAAIIGLPMLIGYRLGKG